MLKLIGIFGVVRFLWTYCKEYVSIYLTPDKRLNILLYGMLSCIVIYGSYKLLKNGPFFSPPCMIDYGYKCIIFIHLNFIRQPASVALFSWLWTGWSVAGKECWDGLLIIVLCYFSVYQYFICSECFLMCCDLPCICYVSWVLFLTKYTMTDVPLCFTAWELWSSLLY